MKRNIYCTVLTVVFSLNFTFCQKNEYSALLISSSLKENANAVVRDNFIEITIEDVR